jgi:hypothetical protein
VIVTCVRWYLRFSLSLRDVEELMAERDLAVDHTTIWRWAQAYGPEVYRRLSGEVRRKSSTWHVDETFVRIAGRWMYLFRAVDGGGQTVDFYLSETRDREAAKVFLKRALGIRTIGNRTCLPGMVCAAILQPFENCRAKASYTAADNALDGIAITGSNPITVISSGACEPCRDHGRKRRYGQSFKGLRQHR